MRDPRQDVPTDEAPPPAGRWSWPITGLEIFWPVLAVVLASAVIFVASVAHSSMDSVGVPLARSGAETAKPAVTRKPLLIVQVSSHATRSAAQAASQELIGRGYQTRILDSDDYRPLNRGYYVVYLGPYPATASGRAEAKRVQVRLAGALVRDIRPR